MTEEDFKSAAAGCGEKQEAPAGARDKALETRLTRQKFLADIRHELRTPINHIVGYSEMLQEEATDRGQEGFIPDLQRIHAAGQQLLVLINDNLNPAKMETGEMSVSQLRHELRTRLNAIIGYSEMLEEEATDQGQEDFIPDVQKIRSAAERFLASMNDTPTFSEVGETRSERGTPSKVAGSRDVASTILPWEEAKTRPSAAGHGFLLVVDDDELNRNMLSRRLERQGHRVAVAESGAKALEMIGSNKFDLVLLDIIMPDTNGYEVLERLKGDDDFRHIPVIMLSSVDEVESIVKCIEIGAEDYLPKPFNPVLLRARIDACLEKKRLRDQEVFYLQQIENGKKRADDLLNVILPEQVVEEMKVTNRVKPRRYENVAVLFCDIVEFTSYCDSHAPEQVISGLQCLVEAYEDLAERHELEKIKTIGDSFMAAAGLLRPVEHPVLNCVRCGLGMISVARQMPANWHVRVGIHFGPVMAGVVGQRQYLFDLWGDTVNTAARIESHGVADSVNLSRAAWQQIVHLSFGEPLGVVQVKGKGELEIIRFKEFRET